MRRACALAITLLLAFLLCGCGDTQNETNDDVAENQQFSTDIPPPDIFETIEAPEPTPVRLLNTYEMIYVENTSDMMGIKYYCPRDWKALPANKSIVYEEPSPEGMTPARMSITYKRMKAKPSAKALRAQMNEFFHLIDTQYKSFTPGEVNEKVKALNSQGYRQRYTAVTGDGEMITGYVLLCYTENDKRLYLIHFMANDTRYTELDAMWNQVIMSIKRA